MEFIVNNLVYFWLIIAFFFLILEMGSPGLFFFLAFFFGGLGAAALTFFTDSLMVQTVIFFLGTVSALFFLRYYARAAEKDRPHERTNVYALQGKRGFVIKRITVEMPGLVKIDGEIWVARSLHGELLEEKVSVEVVDVRGAHVIVKKA